VSNAYCVPASPANPATPEAEIGVEIAGVVQQVDVWGNVKHQVDPLNGGLCEKQGHNPPAPGLPTCTETADDLHALVT